jgi:hypothetical protein
MVNQFLKYISYEHPLKKILYLKHKHTGGFEGVEVNNLMHKMYIISEHSFNYNGTVRYTIVTVNHTIC